MYVCMYVCIHTHLQLQLVKVCPRVTEVRVERARAVKPHARLVELAVRVEETCDGANDKGVVLAALRFSLGVGFSLGLGFSLQMTKGSFSQLCGLV